MSVERKRIEKPIELKRQNALRDAKVVSEGNDPDVSLGLYVLSALRAFFPALILGGVTNLAGADAIVSVGAFLVTELVATFFFAQLGRWGAAVAVAILENAGRLDE